jgi:hypothetical protein
MNCSVCKHSIRDWMYDSYKMFGKVLLAKHICLFCGTPYHTVVNTDDRN